MQGDGGAFEERLCPADRRASHDLRDPHVSPP
jgi:hypothetical protein